MRKKLLAAMLLCLLSGSAGFPEAAGTAIVATSLPIDPADPAHRSFGRLRYLGGWQLTSRQRDFGGYSALAIDGDRFLALADTGQYMRFRMPAPGRIEQPYFGRLPAYAGKKGARRDRDSEAMAIGPDGDVWISFEHRNAILRFAPGFERLIARARPPAMREWSQNSGPEAMARLADGRFIVLSEGRSIGQGAFEALLFPGDPTDPANPPVRFGYHPPSGYVPTDAQQMRDGRIIVLNRRFGLFDGFWTTITILDPAAIRKGAVVTGEIAVELRPPLNIDNMEGIAVTEEKGRTILWLISDDNQLPIERTLLMKFALEERR